MAKGIKGFCRSRPSISFFVGCITSGGITITKILSFLVLCHNGTSQRDRRHHFANGASFRTDMQRWTCSCVFKWLHYHWCVHVTAGAEMQSAGAHTPNGTSSRLCQQRQNWKMSAQRSQRAQISRFAQFSLSTICGRNIFHVSASANRTSNFSLIFVKQNITELT